MGFSVFTGNSIKTKKFSTVNSEQKIEFPMKLSEIETKYTVYS